jgi:hypothetical protein
MIIVFPLLTDESINANILPGICKALEKFIILYELDEVVRSTGLKILSIGGQLISTARSASTLLAKTKMESTEILEEGSKPIKGPPLKGETVADRDKRYEDELEKWANSINQAKEKRDAEKYQTDKIRGSVDNVFNTMKNIKDLATVHIDMPHDQNLSLEPSYITVNTNTGTKVIGIKVIPFPVKSTKNNKSLAELLTDESSLNFFNSLLLKISRKAIRSFWALCRGLRIPFLADRVLSGDPEKDILWASTYHKRYVFCLLNFSDMTDSNFFRNAGGIHKLHSLGWNSFVAADDINKRAIFCMKQFHGLCSTIPYQMIYSSIGKDQSKVYDTLEDVIEKGEDAEESDESKSSSSSPLIPYAKYLKEEGVLPNFDLEKFDGSIDGLREGMYSEIVSGIEAYKQSLPDRVKTIIERYEDGIPFEKLIEIDSTLGTFSTHSGLY